MDKKPPTPSDLKASFKWLKWKFAIKGQARGALSHVNRCLNEIASYEYDFLISKANYLGYLEQWEELEELLKYIEKRYPDEAKVQYEWAEYHLAHGNWMNSLSHIKKAEKLYNSNKDNFRELLYDVKIACLVAMDKKTLAIREAQRIIKKYPKFSLIKSLLKSIKTGTFKTPEPWA